MNRKTVVWLLLILLIAAGLYVGFHKETQPPLPPESPTPVQTPLVTESLPPAPAKTPSLAPVVVPTKKPAAPVKPPILPPPAAMVPATHPSPVEIHKELIPKDIEIIRVYYTAQLTGPDTQIEFDINGSGFTKEFEKMITAESGNDKVSIKNLTLVTLNQIHGTLVIDKKALTAVSFPQVLIQGKVVFRAPDPFAVIRPGEVLNVILTEMGENGRTGRIRVFTNLSNEAYEKFSIGASTPSIVISDLSPHLPYIVDATIDTGWRNNGGEFDLNVQLDKKIIFERKGFIRIVQPNVGHTGLVQQLRARDGFHRPGDQAPFVVMGSGFLPEDMSLISAVVGGFSQTVSSFSFVGPGRLELWLSIPLDAKPGKYAVELKQGDNSLLNASEALVVVDKNWARSLKVAPALRPAGKSTLSLSGRDFDKALIENITVETDEPGLKVGAFKWITTDLATADISCQSNVAAGDYLIKLTSGGRAITPALGSIIQVEKN